MEKTEFKSGEALPLQKLCNFFANPIDLEKDKRLSGVYAWIIIAAFIVAYDSVAIKTKKAETLTRFFWRQTENKFNAVAPVSIWALLTVHLLFEKSIRKRKFGNPHTV